MADDCDGSRTSVVDCARQDFDRTRSSASRRASVRVELSGPHTTEGLVEALFHNRLVAAGRRRLRTAYWSTDATTPTIPGAQELFVTQGENWHRSILELGRSLLHVVLGQGTVTVRIAHDTDEEAAAALDAAHHAFPECQPAKDQAVRIWIWSGDGLGTRALSRSIPVPTWQQIRTNYSGRTQSVLDTLMRNGRPLSAGRLLVWTGEPGTGKTTALRALSWEWRHNYAVHCVSDPDVLLGRSDYLLELLSHADDPNLGNANEGRGLVVVLEDAGELLTRDAKERVGHGLSRLLNVADGLLGSDRNLLVLITTNEPVRVLHPAIVRAGRCASQIEFTRLPADETCAWLQARQSTRSQTGAATLADLFAVLRGDEPTPPEAPLGF